MTKRELATSPRTEMSTEARRDLRVLEAVSENERITQRGLATRLGIALGLTNVYLKRLVRKGYIKCVNVQSNRILYLITPQGISEKTRLTCEYIQYSLYVYREARQHLWAVLQRLVSSGHRRVAIYGTGEAAELAYLSLRELGLEPVAVFDGDGTSNFLGSAVRRLAEHDEDTYDIMIVATLERSDALTAMLASHGVPRHKLVSLLPGEADVPAMVAARS